MNADNRVIASGLTSGGTGDVSGMEFVTWTVDKTGKTSENLAGYQLVTVAKVAYVSNSVADFRYALNQITLVDAPGNTASAALSLRVDAKTCYSYTTTSYNYLQNCSGLYFRNSRSVSNGDGAGGTMTEFGYYALSGTSSETTFNTA